MRFQWIAYDAAYYDIVESWMDEETKRFTGCDEGWFDYVDDMMHDEISRPGENFWCKVILDKEVPFAVMALFLTDEKMLCVTEYVVAPEFRGRGLGTAALRELLCCEPEIIGREFLYAGAVIFPNNLASQRAFLQAGFRFESAHPDGDAWYYRFDKNRDKSNG